MVTKDEVFEALHQVEDPELGMDIVELGLLYDAEIEGPKVKVIHSLTSMGCPAGPMIQEDIHRVVVGAPRRGGRRDRADMGPALDARADVRRRQVHPRLRLAGISSRIFPNCSPASSRSWAARASASGKTVSITGVAPAATRS